MANKRKQKGIVIVLLVVFLMVGISASLLVMHWFEKEKQADAEIMVDLTQKTIESVFAVTQNEAVLIKEHIENNPDHKEQFQEIAKKTISNEGITQIYLINGTTVTDMVSEDGTKDEVGKDMNQLPYIFNMARLLKQSTVEGPVQLKEGTDSFLFIEPILSGDTCVGEVVIVTDAAYTIGELGLSYLDNKGYEYELWRVDSQDGEKYVVDKSLAGKDLSEAVRRIFFLPTEWTLAIEPASGWILPQARWISISVGALTFLLLVACAYVLQDKGAQRKREHKLRNIDAETGFYTQSGLVEDTNRRIRDGMSAYTLVIFVMDEYVPLARKMGKEHKQEYLNHVVKCLRDGMSFPHSCARLSAETYAIIIFDEMERSLTIDMAKEFAIDLLWKMEIDGRKEFIEAKWSMCSCPEDGTDINQLIEEAIKKQTQL